MVATVLLALCFALLAYADEADRKAKWFVSFFKGAAHSLKIDRTGAHFHTRHFGPKFAMGDPRLHEGRGWQFEFTLSQRGERFFSPEHHGESEFVVKRITPDSIVLGYKSSSDWQWGSRPSGRGEFTLHPFDNGTTFETEDAQTKNAQ